MITILIIIKIIYFSIFVRDITSYEGYPDVLPVSSQQGALDPERDVDILAKYTQWSSWSRCK